MERNEDTIPLVVQGTTIPMRNWNSRFFDCLKDPCLSLTPHLDVFLVY